MAGQIRRDVVDHLHVGIARRGIKRDQVMQDRRNGIDAYRHQPRQNQGANSTSTVKSSSRPSSMPAANTHFALSGRAEKFPVGPMMSPSAGPTLQIAEAAPETAVKEVEPDEVQQSRQHGKRQHEQEEKAHD